MKYLLFLFLFICSSGFAQLSANFTILSSTCSSGECMGMIQAEGLNGTAPYTYDWFDQEVDSSNPSIAINLCGGTYPVKITDALGNEFLTDTYLSVLSSPEIKIDITPGDTIYIKNPSASFSYTNLSEADIDINGWLWGFGDGNTSSEENATYTYSEEGVYDISLRIVHQTHCDTTYYHQLLVKNIELFIPNIITPNGDGKNDLFIITSKDQANLGSSKHSSINDFYVSNELVIYNRWSQVVFESKNYANDWDGSGLAEGVYFYVLKCIGENDTDTFKGSLTILGTP